MTLWQDIRYGCRMLWKSPGFTAVAVLSLALGIGANTTIFTGVKGLLLTPLPGVESSGELITVHEVLTGAGGRDISNSYPNYTDFRDRNQVFSNLAAYSLSTFSLSGGEGQPQRIWGQIVSGNFFDTLGVRAARGRTFLPEEDTGVGAHPVAVISDKLWRNHFGSDPDIVGRSVLLNNHSFQIVGVAPANFGGSYVGLSMEMWVPMAMQPLLSSDGSRLARRGNQWLQVIGRLKGGVTLEQAQADLKSISRGLSEQYPQTNSNHDVSTYTLLKDTDGAQQILLPVFGILMAVAGVVLLIACANVANLLLARASSRRREFGIRAALGAGRGRLMRQLLAESLVLAGLGGALGFLLTFWTADVFGRLVPSMGFPVEFKAGVDARVFVFTLAVSAVTAIVFGLVPAWQASKPDIVATLKDETGAIAGSGHKSRLRNALVIAQIALSVVLLVAAGLLIRSLQQAQSADPGFNPDNVLLASFDLFPSGYDEARGAGFYSGLIERVEVLPGVAAATIADKAPLSLFNHSEQSVGIEGYVAREDEDVNIEYGIVGPNYFRALQIPLARGRDFAKTDREQAPRVAIISEALARRYFGADTDPVGKRIDDGGKTQLEIVGVAKDITSFSAGTPPKPYLYLPLLQNYSPEMTLVVRTSGDPLTALGGVRDVVHEMDANLPVFNEKTLIEQARTSLFAQRMAMKLLSVFGALALVLAVIGLYGVMAYSVAQRTREIGIRIALGARAGDIRRMIVRQGMALDLVGALIGLAASFAVTRFLSGLLYGVSATDPLTFASVALILLVVALLASYVPARRATKVDPMVALRYE
ncbi:MAG: ABC transporter permease [Pyrinomonadaceae bacterium]